MNMRNILTFTFLALCSVNTVSAVPAFVEESKCSRVQTETVTTTSSSAEIPAPLHKPKKIVPLGCDRPFLYRAELYTVDPPQGQDAATLKYFVQTVPEANAMLDTYQANRIKSRLSAYSGTFGLALAIFATPISHLLTKRNPDSLRKTLNFIGYGIAAGGFIYSFTLLRSNEGLIPKSVDSYNRAKPNDQIELKFTTGWSF